MSDKLVIAVIGVVLLVLIITMRQGAVFPLG